MNCLTVKGFSVSAFLLFFLRRAFWKELKFSKSSLVIRVVDLKTVLWVDLIPALTDYVWTYSTAELLGHSWLLTTFQALLLSCWTDLSSDSLGAQLLGVFLFYSGLNWPVLELISFPL